MIYIAKSLNEFAQKAQIFLGNSIPLKAQQFYRKSLIIRNAPIVNKQTMSTKIQMATKIAQNSES